MKPLTLTAEHSEQMNPEDRAKAEAIAKEAVSETYFASMAIKQHLLERITAALLPLLEQNMELVECLEPFARSIDEAIPDNYCLRVYSDDCDNYLRAGPLVGDLRRAAALLSRLQPKSEVAK